MSDSFGNRVPDVLLQVVVPVVPLIVLLPGHGLPS
jgi:hypothetical protein